MGIIIRDLLRRQDVPCILTSEFDGVLAAEEGHLGNGRESTP